MRLIHTGDWHLGRLFHNQPLIDDQRHVLWQLLELVDDVKPAAVIVAGDLYDRAVPPPAAVELLNEVLTELVERRGVPVVAIAGNHDSGVRVGFASALLSERGLCLAGKLTPTPAPLTLSDEHGPVFVHALPFADPAEARHAYDDADIHDQEGVIAAGVARALAATPADARRVLVAHAFVAGAATTEESERPLSVGGATQVPAAVFDGFDFVALGHLHRAQRCGSDALRYAGSLLKYSFAEHDHDKSVGVVEIGAPGSAPGAAGEAGRARVTVETSSLRPLHDVRRLEGTLAELLERGGADPHRDDYVLASLLDRGALLDPIGRLRAAYPNTLAIERPAYELERAGGEPPARSGAVSDVELFDAFFGYATGDALDVPQRREAAP